MTDGELFATVHHALQGVPNRRGWYDAVCPNCGKEPERGQVHFGYHTDGRARCFVCGYSASLYKLCDLLRLDVGAYVPPAKVEKPIPPIARWRLNPDKLLQGYLTHPERIDRWHGYKPLTADSIERYRLGYGRLPFQWDNGEWYMSRAEWLTVPVYEDGALIALRGRNVTDNGPKWISATGSQYGLFGLEYVYPGATTFICENYADAIWLQQAHPDWCAVAIGGATTWKAVWAYRLAAKHPGLVVVALDNDLPGNGGGVLREMLIAEWTATHPKAAIPVANGPRIANDCIGAGMRTILFQWPENAPAKAGLDWALGQPQPMF